MKSYHCDAEDSNNCYIQELLAIPLQIEDAQKSPDDSIHWAWNDPHAHLAALLVGEDSEDKTEIGKMGSIHSYLISKRREVYMLVVRYHMHFVQMNI